MASTRNYLRIEISGESLFDLEIALDEVHRKVSDGFLSGFGSNDTGDYEFTLTQELFTLNLQEPSTTTSTLSNA